MRKPTAWVLAVLLLLPLLPAVAEESLTTYTNPAGQADTIGVQAGTKLTVGMTTATSGYFATDLWGTNAADICVRSLLYGYNTITWLRTGELMFDGTAIAGVNVLSESDGRRVYVISLMTDLVYSDGTPITAKDYIFSLLLSASPEIAALGGAARGLNQFAGYEEYNEGRAESIRGIRLISDDSFSIEVDERYLPYFYGIAMFEIIPYPMHVIAPGCDILDTGNGVSIGPGAGAALLDAQALGFTPGEFSEGMLRKTLLDPETGYLFNPRVTSGPYTLDAYDKETRTVSLVLNPRYLGNYEGDKPHIERLELRAVRNDEVADLLASGEIDLVSQLTNGEAIDQALALTYAGGAALKAQNHPRSGLAYLALACEKGPTADTAVRRAIAQAVDRNAIIAAVSPYALPVYGYYGMGQWMMSYSGEEGAAQDPSAPEMQEALAALEVPFDIDGAKAALDQAGWNLDAQGNAYAQGIRYRRTDGALEPLVIRWAKTEGSALTDAIEGIIAGPFAEAGIDLTVTEVSFAEVLRQFYRLAPREYDMFFLASDFLKTFDPYYDYHTGDAYQKVINTSGLRDETLMALALEMRETPPAESAQYVTRWLDFQRAWAEAMPFIPLYSNVYFDFYTDQLQDYDIATALNWGYAMSYAWLGDPAEAEEVGFFPAAGN